MWGNDDIAKSNCGQRESEGNDGNYKSCMGICSQGGEGVDTVECKYCMVSILPTEVQYIK